jgi:hypothetical protein
MKTTVQMKQIVAADLFLDPISNVHKLPNTCNKTEARRLGAKHVSDDEHKEIYDKIARRAALDHNEMAETNLTATVTPPAAALMTVTPRTVMKAAQITTKKRNVPLLPWCWCSVWLLAQIYFLWSENIFGRVRS